MKSTEEKKTRTARTNEEILSSLACTVNEAAQVLNCRWEEVRDLIETKKVHSFAVGKRTKVSVESLRAYARGDLPAAA